MESGRWKRRRRKNESERVRARTRDVQASVISRSVTRRNSIFGHIHPFPLFPSSAKKPVLSDRLMNIICDRNFSYFGAEQTDPTGHFYATMAPTPSFSLSFSLSLSLFPFLFLTCSLSRYRRSPGSETASNFAKNPQNSMHTYGLPRNGMN